MTRESEIAGYREFLNLRDGEADLLRHRLSKREAFFDDLDRNPVHSGAYIDPTAYARNLARRRPESGLSRELLWILATAKANQAERFGVGLAELLGRIQADDPTRLHMILQESYHTRILADVVSMFGLTVRPSPPRALIRLLIHFMILAPERWTLPIVGATEMGGCVLFRELRDKGVELFADEPAVAERIKLLYNEILADEICHVGFIAARLSERGRARMRRLYARVAPVLVSQISEIVELFGRHELKRRFSAFDLAATAAELPRLVFVAAPI